jgi:hypothetical protein
MSRKRLPKQPALVLDEKFVNMMRYHQLLEDELAKPQKKLIYVSSMMGAQSEVREMMIERLAWLFRTQFPHSKFIWGTVKKNSSLPDKMPKTLQRAMKRYKENNP